MGQRESGRIHKPSRWIDQIAERISRGGKPWGDCLPWTKCDELIRLRPGELSIWGGMSGHKKSMLLGWVMCNLAKNYESPVALASLKCPQKKRYSEWLANVPAVILLWTLWAISSSGAMRGL